MKNHYTDITEHIKILGRDWKQQYANIWRKITPKSKYYLPHANSTLKYTNGEIRDYVNPVYKDIDITYSIDENGFRHYPNYSPTSSKKIYVFGCSMTFGVSAPDEHTWPFLLANKFGGWQLKNYGIPGIGAGQIARVCYQAISSLKKEDYPDVVYVLLPDVFRTEYIGNEENRHVYSQINLHTLKYPTLKDVIKEKYDPNNTYQYISGNTLEENIEGKIYSYYNFTSAAHCFFETVKAFKLIQETLESRGIRWFWYTWSPFFYKFKSKTTTTFFSNNTLMDENGFFIIERGEHRTGRDGTHVGYEYSNELADAFLNLHNTYETNKKSN